MNAQRADLPIFFSLRLMDGNACETISAWQKSGRLLSDYVFKDENAGAERGALPAFVCVSDRRMGGREGTMPSHVVLVAWFHESPRSVYYIPILNVI